MKRAASASIASRPAGACDVEWLTETATLLAHADTFLLLRRTIGWDIPNYQDWLECTWTRLVAGSAAAGL